VVIRGEVIVVNEPGVHTRPASMLASLAARFRSRVTVSDTSAQSVDCKSIMGILMLAAITGTQLTIRAEGDDAEEAVRALVRLIGSGFDEKVMEDEKTRVGRNGP
jgi:phosphotransferase system HPr (HPr) family protein